MSDNVIRLAIGLLVIGTLLEPGSATLRYTAHAGFSASSSAEASGPPPSSSRL